MKSSLRTLGKGIMGCLEIAIQVLLPTTRRGILVPLSVGSTRKGMITSSESQNLELWGSKLNTTVGTDTTFSTPRTGRSNSTRMKWVYHTLKPKTPRMWPLYRQFEIILNYSPRNKSMQLNSLAEPME